MRSSPAVPLTISRPEDGSVLAAICEMDALRQPLAMATVAAGDAWTHPVRVRSFATPAIPSVVAASLTSDDGKPLSRGAEGAKPAGAVLRRTPLL